jgi:hypothetical protein
VARYRLHERGYLPAASDVDRQLHDHVRIIERALETADGHLDERTARLIRSNVYGRSALVRYALRDLAGAATALEAAIAIEPLEWARAERLGELVAQAAFDLGEGRDDIDPDAYVERVASNLPRALDPIAARVRRLAGASVWKVRAHRADVRGDARGVVRASMAAARIRPASLWEQGALTRLARGLIGAATHPARS